METKNPLEKSQPLDQITSRTPKKLPHPPQRIKYHHNRHPSTPLPEKYEILVKLFDALDASLKLLRLRKSIPVFSKVRVMIESISERRFTHQHLAKLKFLLPEEIGIRKVLMPDEKTRCMKHDLHLSLHEKRIVCGDKRKQKSKIRFARDRLLTRLLEYYQDHPEVTEIPEEKLPEPFNQCKNDLNFKKPSLCPSTDKYSHLTIELETRQVSHLPPSFKRHFSKRGISNDSNTSLKSRSQSSNQSNSSNELEIVAQFPETLYVEKMQKGTPTKSSRTPIKPGTPNLLTPKRCRLHSIDECPSSMGKGYIRYSCARSLQFEGPLRNEHVELQDDEECSDILDLIPGNLVQELKAKEERALKMEKRKQIIKNLPKLFDRICIIFQNLKTSAIREEALIHHLTERHFDITDECEVWEQVKLLQEIIPEWITSKLSPSGNTLYSIDKALNPNTLRLTLDKAM